MKKKKIIRGDTDKEIYKMYIKNVCADALLLKGISFQEVCMKHRLITRSDFLVDNLRYGEE